MGRPAGAKNKPKERPGQAENCGNCLCSTPFQNNPQMRNWLQCRLFPTETKKQPHQWCRQWELKPYVSPVRIPDLPPRPDPEKGQEAHPMDVPLEPVAEIA